jgi:hypothetical protein
MQFVDHRFVCSVLFFKLILYASCLYTKKALTFFYLCEYQSFKSDNISMLNLLRETVSASYSAPPLSLFFFHSQPRRRGRGRRREKQEKKMRGRAKRGEACDGSIVRRQLVAIAGLYAPLVRLWLGLSPLVRLSDAAGTIVSGS